MILRDSIWIDAPPERIVQFFENLEENYRRWHPDHLRFEWTEGRGVKEGVAFVFEERIAGKVKKMEAVYTRVDGVTLEFSPRSRFFRLLLPRMLFRLVPEGGGTRFEAENHVRIGPIGARLNRKELDAVHRHMREEGENMKRLMEEGA